MISSEELVEGFISGIVILIGISLLVEIQFGTDITPIINALIELAIPLFLAAFVAVILLNILSEV